MSIKLYKTSCFLAVYLLLGIMLCSTLYAAPNIDSLIENLLSGDYSVSFEAEEVVALLSDSETRISRYKIGRLLPDKMRKEKYRIDGTLEEIMVHDRDMQIISYPEKKIVTRRPRSDKALSNVQDKSILALLKKNYNIELTGDSVVAGRSSFALNITPKDKGSRPSLKVWMDHKTGMPLRTETYGPDGFLSFFSYISKITVNPAFSRDYFVILVPNGTAAYEEQPETDAAAVQLPEISKSKILPSLSGGYVLKEKRVDEKGNFQLVYHDGLNSLSVFSEDWDDNREDHFEMLARKGDKMVERVKKKSFEGYFCSRGSENILSFISDKHRYTVVGDVSREGLINISLDLQGRKVKR